MIRKASYVTLIALPVAVVGVLTLQYRLPIGPIVLGLAIISLLGLLMARRPVTGAIPDLLFGALV